MTMQAQAPNWISLAVMAVIIPVILFFRFRSMGKERPLKPERLWILPAIYTVFAGFIFVGMPPHGLAWVYVALALLVGLALGWQRGKMMHITVHPEEGTLNQKASPAAMIFIIVLIVLRMGTKAVIGTGGGTAMHGTALLATDILIALALGFIISQRVEMYLRAKRILAAHAPH